MNYSGRGPRDRAVRLPALLGVLAFGISGGLVWFAFGGGWLSWIAAGCAAAGLLAFLRGEIARWQLAARTHPRILAGLVFVEEGRIILLEGGESDELLLEDIESIWMIGRRNAWVLHLAGARAVEIPLSAIGSEDLPNSFVSLPGFDLGKASRALRARTNAPEKVWSRQ